MLGALCLIALVVVLVAAGGSDSDEEAGRTEVTTAPTAPPPTTAATASPDGVFGPIPGFTYESAPSSVVSDARDNFERGFRGALDNLPGVDVDVNQVVVGMAGRTVLRRGDEVALALAVVLDARWAAQVSPDDALSEFGSGDPSERTTIRGEQAVYYTEEGADGLAAYKSGTFLIVAGEKGNRAVLREIMTGLLANAS